MKSVFTKRDSVAQNLSMFKQPKPNAAKYSLANGLLAVGLLLFLAFSFKLAGGLTAQSTDQPILSQTDSVISTLNQPNQ